MDLRRKDYIDTAAVRNAAVRVDFVVAVVLTVIAPLLLLMRAIQRKQQALVSVLLSYWRVSSLLMVAVYLLIGQRPIAFVCGIAARLFIPWTLLRHAQQNDPWYARWRIAVSSYCLLGAVLNSGTLRCFWRGRHSQLCQAYIESAQQYGELIHPNVSRAKLGTIGELGLYCYVIGALGVFGKRLLDRVKRQM